MEAKIIDGAQCAKNIRKSIAEKVANINNNRVPGLAVVKVGDDPASEIYVNYKKKACKEVGFKSFSYTLPSDTSSDELLDLINELNNNNEVDGILVQLPLPKQLNAYSIIENIDPRKDIDGFHFNNMGRLAINKPMLRPCTPKGVITLIDTIPDYDISGRNAVVVGASNIVGRPMALELLAREATVTICHSKTQRLEDHVKNAEILVVAVGISMFIPGTWIRPGAVVIDVGINRLSDNRVCGDVFFDEAVKVAGHITPVPGGVGPMTIASLMENTWQAYESWQK